MFPEIRVSVGSKIKSPVHSLGRDLRKRLLCFHFSGMYPARVPLNLHKSRLIHLLNIEWVS